MKKLLFSLIVTISICAHSQTNYFVSKTDEGTDTIFTKNLSYKVTSQGYLSSINYTDSEFQSWVIEGKKNLVNVETFFIGGGWTDKIPQKTTKPDSYVRWASRVVDGKLKVNYYNNEISVNNIGTGFMGGRTTTSTFTKFYIKMPDGTFYDIRKSSDRKNYIIPYLKKCDAFNLAYKGDFDEEFNKFVRMIQLYNSVCK